LFMLVLAGTFAYGVLAVGPYDNRNDDMALIAASLSSVLVVFLRALGSGMHSLGTALTAITGMIALVPCALTLLVAMGLTSSTLGRLEAQGFQDRCLPCTVPGWGLHGHRARAEGSGNGAAGSIADFGDTLSGSCGMIPEFADGVPDGHAVDVVMPGQRKAFTIVLPGMARPKVVHTQLLPPVAGRNGDPESLPPCAATGDRARLPVPASLLFPKAAATASVFSEVGTSVLEHRRSVPPLVALLAPGHTGRLIYSQAENNEAEQEWREAINGFFGLDGSLLAEEAQRLVEQHAAPDSGQAARHVLVIVEVLPAWAAEFLDERHGPPSRT